MPVTCWAPCFKLNQGHLDSRDATRVIAWYTFVLHALSLVYFLDARNGGPTDVFYSPLFEYSKSDMYMLAKFLAFYSFAYLILGSLGLLRGIKTETRIYYIPWLWMTAFEILYLIFFSSYLIWRYTYYNPTLVFLTD
ncbi:hypothetical protein GZH46_00482 [Fragariocoptes setiger]|uniref:Uncharacterized protein n=1 Tax=Fragariocoptes setiger TaxID=1670756 RepID=A0ABQ7SC12_9ACAR|nr:hypothetical protein GZH46_00482 [Fragariocoptes setiger]